MLKSLKNLWPFHQTEIEIRLKNDWQNCQMLAIDLELSGINANVDHIISMGWQAIAQQQLSLSNNDYALCKTEIDLEQSPTIHGIDQKSLQKGETLNNLLQRLIDNSLEPIWVFHHAELDMKFLLPKLKKIAAAENLLSAGIITLDTMQLQQYILEKNNTAINSDTLSINASRRFFNLPKARAHHALDDAFASAELLLAQLHYLCAGDAMPLKDLQHTGAIKVWH